MITQLNIPAPPVTQLRRVSLIELLAPLLGTEQYFGVDRRREGESPVCAVVHPYTTAHVYAAAFPALLPLLLAEVCRGLQMSEVTWADIAYTSPAGARPELLVRTTRLASATADIIWQDRDRKYAQSWEGRGRPIMRMLDRIQPDRPGSGTPDAGIAGESSAAPARVEGSPDAR